MKQTGIVLAFACSALTLGAQTGFGCWGSQSERMQSTMGEVITLASETFSSGFQQGDWDEITAVEEVEDAGVRCFYNKSARQIVIENEHEVGVGIYTAGGTMLKRVASLPAGRNGMTVGEADKLLLIRIENRDGKSARTFKILVE